MFVLTGQSSKLQMLVSISFSCSFFMQSILFSDAMQAILASGIVF
jgi:hypothetical protein